jgi:hypothetical protein
LLDAVIAVDDPPTDVRKMPEGEGAGVGLLAGRSTVRKVRIRAAKLKSATLKASKAAAIRRLRCLRARRRISESMTRSG